MEIAETMSMVVMMMMSSGKKTRWSIAQSSDWRKINWGDDQQVRERANQVITQPIREKEQTCKRELISWLMIECVQQQQQKLDWGNRTDNKQTRNDIFQVLLTVIIKSRGRMCRHWPHTASVWQLKLQRVKEWRTSKEKEKDSGENTSIHWLLITATEQQRQLIIMSISSKHTHSWSGGGGHRKCQ